MENLKYYLSFLATPRSGHTLVSAILNANPNVYCSNQLNVFSIFKQYQTNLLLFYYMREYSKNPETWKSTTQIPHVPKSKNIIIGDKTGHRTTVLLGENPQLLGEFKQFIELPIKWIHVVRNSFDNISTWARLNHENKIRNGKKSNQSKELDEVIVKYAKLNETIAKLKRSENILTINHEYVIMRMHDTLKQMADFLEISFDPKWRDNVRNSVWKKPRITRSQVQWNQNQIKEVNNIIKRYSWLKGYAYNGCGKCK